MAEHWWRGVLDDIVNRINQCKDLIPTGFSGAVTRLAQRHFAEYGLQDVKEEYRGIQYVVKLKHCEIRFWWYKADVGSSIKPISQNGATKYTSRIIAEEGLPLVGLLGSVPAGATEREIERQMRLIVEKYREALEGDFGDWPREG